MDHIFDFIGGVIGQQTYRLLRNMIVTRGASYEIPLPDKLLAKVAIVDAVAGQAVAEPDVRVEEAFVNFQTSPPFTHEQQRLEHFQLVQDALHECTHCTGPAYAAKYRWRHTGQWTVGTRFFTFVGRRRVARPSTLVNPHSPQPLTLCDELALVFPFLCRCEYRASNELTDLDAYLAAGMNFLHIPYRYPTAVRGDPLEHKEDCKNRGASRNVELVRDTLGWHHTPVSIWRWELRQNEACCSGCWPTEHHYINPRVWDSTVDVGIGHPGLSMCRAAEFINRHLLTTFLDLPERIQLTSWDAAYCSPSEIWKMEMPGYCFVCSQADADVVRALGWVPVHTTIVGNTRTLAALRVYAAAMIVSGVQISVTNASLRDAYLMDVNIDMVAGIEASAQTTWGPVVNNCLIKGGASLALAHLPLTKAALLAPVYGIEEAVLFKANPYLTRLDHMSMRFDVTEMSTPLMKRRHPLAVRSPTPNHYAVARGVGRNQTVVAWRIILARARRARTGLTFLDAWRLPLGSVSDLGPVHVDVVPHNPPSTLGQPSTVSMAIAQDVGIVNWFVFGSAGDVTPILALARVMRNWGVPVVVVNTLTPEEQTEVLAAVEHSNALQAAPKFIHAMVSAATAPGTVFGPPEFPSVSMGVNLRPPPSVIHPVDFGLGPLFNVVVEVVLRGWSPVVNIGAYRGVHWLPRSANGEDFLVQSTNRNRPIDIMLAWGSSTLPKPIIDGAVEVLPGDHYSQFETAKIVVCHGGAGTVQTAAAAGARVVTGTLVLDRRYREPLHAGRAVVPGADPDSVLLTLLPLSPKVWIWAWKHSWGMFFRALRWGYMWVFGPALWLFVALTTRTFVVVLRMPRARLVFSSGFAQTITATVFSGLVGPSVAALCAPQIVRIIQFALAHLGLSPAAAILNIIHFLARIAYTGSTWGFVFAGMGWWSIPLSIIVSTFKLVPILFSELTAWLFVVRPQPPPGGYARIGISWAFNDSRVPVFHTRFISPDFAWKYEGQWVGGRRGMGNLYRMAVVPMDHDIVGEWTFETTVPWATLAALPPISAPYSPIWNCQTAVLHSARGMWALLGWGIVVTLPVGIYTVMVMTLATIFLIVAIWLCELIPLAEMIGMVAPEYFSSSMTRRLCYNGFDTILANPSDWFATTLALLGGVLTGWSDSDPERCRHLYGDAMIVVRAQSIQELHSIYSAGRMSTDVGVMLLREKMKLLSEETYPHSCV